MLTANQIVELTNTFQQVADGTLTRERYEEIIENLTPEQQAIWKRINPDVLEPDVYFIAGEDGGSWRKA